MMEKIKIVWRFFRRNVLIFIQKIKMLKYLGNKYQCPVCLRKMARFVEFPKEYVDKLMSYGHIYSLDDYETSNMKNNICPYCKTGDSGRLYALYLRQRLGDLNQDKKYKLLDIAPVWPLTKVIKSFPCIDYRSADLFMEGVDDKVDVQNMRIYKDESIDILICTHVLEHVIDDRKAVREMYRILKVGGWGIIMVPIMLSIDNIAENSEHKSKADRWKYYGFEDHLRMYSKKGFVDRLNEAGFKVDQKDVGYFGSDVFSYNGISSGSVLYVVSK